ncbi:MAG: DnaA N-terminal domain-containing protein, partial [Nitrososphaerales archaeon]
MNDADILWTRCSEILRDQVSDAAWRTSLAGLCPLSSDSEEDSLLLLAPSTWARERIELRFLGLISSVVSDVFGRDVTVRLGVGAPATDPPLIAGPHYDEPVLEGHDLSSFEPAESKAAAPRKKSASRAP